MKKNVHPSYQEVLFVDSSTGTSFVIGTTLQSKEKGTFEGKEYPICRVSISSASHPFFTKANQFVDAEGRMQKFAGRYKKKAEEMKKSQEQAAAPVVAKKTSAKKK